MDCRLALLLGLVSVVCSVASAAKRPYIAAALEHARFGDLNDPPSLVVEENLKRYKKAAEIAASKGADVILYPEYGIFYPGNRTWLKNFLEDIPDPKKIRTNPCEEGKLYLEKPILLALSCIAKENAMVVVANTGDIKNCSGEPDCPEDGVFHFNANVAFDQNGTLLVRYHKEHLFFEDGMDLAREQQDPTFETDFGTFATYICFDVMFKRIAEVANWPQVDGIMFSTMWVEIIPQFASVPFFQSWAIGNNATFIASNIQIPGLYAIGSGIFDGKQGHLSYTYNPDGISKLVVAEVMPSGEGQSDPDKTSVTAIDGDKVWNWEDDGKDVPKICSRAILNETTLPRTELRCVDENTTNYTLVKLQNPSGYVEACNNGMCCSLNYSAENMAEDFYLGVYNGTYNAFDRYSWCEENCFIARCDELNGQQCSTFPRIANTTFDYVELKANFTTPFIYPSVVGSHVRLVSVTEWEHEVIRRKAFESAIVFRNTPGEKLINVAFKARCYDRDPPYVR